MSNPINPDYPIQSVATVDELMDIAVAMEDEAATRYEQLADRTDGPPELVTLFRQLARLERDHQFGLAAWAQREGRPAPIPTRFSWRLPETFGDEDEVRPLDAYVALAIAVRNEERAFAFYTYLAALCAGRADMQRRAEALAREELKHVALLRGMRRRAFHANKPEPPPRVQSLDDLRRLALELEPAAARDNLRNAQEALETYLTIADHATDQEILVESQRLAEGAMARLALLRAASPNADTVID